MFYKLTPAPSTPLAEQGLVPAGRFILHRHTDTDGEHLDLRLEQDGHLQGWRIDDTEFGGDSWATEKPPHPTRWLDDDTGMSRLDAGVYGWRKTGPDEAVLVLEGEEQCREITITRAADFAARTMGDIASALDTCDAAATDAPQLIRDGAAARNRALARLCGLGRELDGAAFDETLWRRTLAGLTLDEIHAQLRAFEIRFDQRYPPEPISQPEPLPDDESSGRSERALEIARA